MTLQEEFEALFEDDETTKDYNYGYKDEIEAYIKSIVKPDLDIIYNTEVKETPVLCYIPSKKLAIRYYESDKFDELTVGKDYFLNLAKWLGHDDIRLLNIYDYEWFNPHKREIIQSMLLHDLTPSKKIYARKTKVREMYTEEAMRFVNDNHLQGGTGSAIKIGLYFEGEPVAMMSFGQSRFKKEPDCYEIIRACYKQGCTVEGGVSKILKYFIKEYKPYKIISYSDIGKFASKSYSNSGMKLVEVTDPGYVWTKDGEELQRYQCMKHKLIAKGWGVESQTENEIMRNQGFYKVYNAGNRKFQWLSTEAANG